LPPPKTSSQGHQPFYELTCDSILKNHESIVYSGKKGVKPSGAIAQHSLQTLRESTERSAKLGVGAKGFKGARAGFALTSEDRPGKRREISPIPVENFNDRRGITR
jgi:hypothetical protein